MGNPNTLNVDVTASERLLLRVSLLWMVQLLLFSLLEDVTIEYFVGNVCTA